MALEASRRQTALPSRRNLTSMRVPRHSATDEAWPDQVNAPGTEHGDEEEDEEDEKGGSISWLLLLLTAGPLVVACVLLGMACFSGDIQSSNYLLKISGKGGKSPKLWLALSGFCLDTGSQTNCSISALNTYYSKAYKTSEVDVGDLKKYLPEDYGTNATLLLVSFVLVGVAAVFTGWAALDMRRAYLLEQEERRSWVAEWMQARRLEMLGVFCAAAAVVCGMAAATDLASSTAAVNATVNAMGGDADSDFTQSQEGSVLSLLYAAQALVGFTILLEVLTLAYDGLMRRVRFEYESLIDDLDAFSRDDFVVLQTRLNKMHALSVLQFQVQAPEHKEQIRRYIQAYAQRHQVELVLRRQKALVMAQEGEYFKLMSQARMAPYPMQPQPYGMMNPYSMPAF